MSKPRWRTALSTSARPAGAARLTKPKEDATCGHHDATGVDPVSRLNAAPFLNHGYREDNDHKSCDQQCEAQSVENRSPVLLKEVVEAHHPHDPRAFRKPASSTKFLLLLISPHSSQQGPGLLSVWGSPRPVLKTFRR